MKNLCYVLMVALVASSGNAFNIAFRRCIETTTTPTTTTMASSSSSSSSSSASPYVKNAARGETFMFSENSKWVLKKVLPVLLSGVLFAGPVEYTKAADEWVSPKYDKVAPWSKDTQYTILKTGTGSELKVGDLVEVRFKGTYRGNTFDDTFSTPEPYYFRAGTGTILKGLDDTVVNMKVGDKWRVNFKGSELSFKDAKKSSPGKPRIPAGAEVDYEVEVVNLPGAGDDFIADYE